MSGIAGIAAADETVMVERMLSRLAHRGRAGRKMIAAPGLTFGIVWNAIPPVDLPSQDSVTQIGCGSGHRISIGWLDRRLTLERDPLGVVPLYYGRSKTGVLCFASEVKALLEATDDITELPPGSRYVDGKLSCYFKPGARPPVDGSPEIIASQLRQRLEAAVQHRISQDEGGAWLSGGLDSSALVALARPHLKTLHTFAAGLPGAPDLAKARVVADFAHTQHHDVVVSFDDMLRVLPEVIYHLESFDALLVRSSITHYLAARAASDYVGDVFSGEGSDELFAGYDYLKTVPPAALNDELLNITARLHNTALQRVDRCASAHGLAAHLCFLDPAVVDFALQIPVELKLRHGVEKWILREALRGWLPDDILTRKKAKFWEGAGTKNVFADYAESRISDSDFNRERTLSTGETLNSKEELMYYRIFREHFGPIKDLAWMGRTQGSPRLTPPT